MSKRLFTNEQEAEIVRRYNAGESSEKLAIVFETNGTSIRNVLKRNKIERRPAAHKMNPIISKEMRQKAVDACVSGMSLEEAGIRFGMHRNTVWKSVNKNGITLYNGRKRSREINDTAFDVLTPEACYWLGFLFADGCANSTDRGSPRLVVGLSAEDRQHLIKLRKFLGSTHAIMDKPPRDSNPVKKGGPIIKTGPTTYFSARSKNLYVSLTSRGILTKRPQAPHHDLANSIDFWRGAVDGDGHVGFTNGYPEINLSGQLPLIQEFGKFLNRNNFRNYNPYSGDGVWLIGTTGSPAKNIIDFLYRNAPIFLDRKMNLATAIIQNRAENYLRDFKKESPYENETQIYERLKNDPFPYPKMMSEETIRKELTHLKTIRIFLRQNEIQSRHVTGLMICAPFFPNRFEARWREIISAVEAWKSEAELRKAIRFQLDHGDPVEPDRIRRVLTLRCRTPTIFRPAIARFIYEMYGRRGGSIWDPCAGYGGRLLGAHVAEMRYIGTDVDEKTIDGNKALASFLNADAKLYCVPAEEFDPPKVDLIFTSPPYFNREQYSDNEKQSWKRYQTLDKWIDGFIEPLIKNAFRALPPKGRLILNVTDFWEKRKQIPIVSRVKNTANENGFRHVSTLLMPLAAMNRQTPSEPIFVFQKD